MTMPQDPTRRGVLRVTLQEPEIRDLMDQYPMLSRTEICDVISRIGPMRHEVETQLALLSSRKR